MKQQYMDVKFRRDTLLLIDTINGIIDEYIRQGYRLTVRQLYYQLVARGYIENTEKSYKRITGVVNDARMAGLMDWDVIEDRTREFIRRSSWNSPAEIIRTCARSYHMDMWASQATRVFCIVEKEALAGVLERACYRWDVPLLAARGYPSGTVLREFVELDLLPALDDGQDILILHLGDHDPSGIDMTRDLEERIHLFSGGYSDQVELRRIALSMEQIEDQQPPPNPAKTTDSRFQDYRRRFGDESWELDALTPSFLTTLVGDAIQNVIDQDKWQEREKEIEEGKQIIQRAAETVEE